MSLNRVVPPNVCGKVQGIIKIKVDEVYWSHKLYEQVLVHFKWWGSSEVFTFFPVDITRKDFSNDDNDARHRNDEEDSANCLQFNVCTSLALFETYLKNSKVFLFSVVSASDDTLLGEVRVSPMDFILTQRPFSSYFQIVNEKGLHLGDLHVCFHLTMNNNEKKSKKRVKLKSDLRIRGTEPTDDWARVTARGLELRQAMVDSVLSSGDHAMASIHIPAENVAPEAKLVDYLMGKELSKPEEELAIKTLQCYSPAQSLVEVTTCAVNPRFVPKTEARVVKSEVLELGHVPKTNERRKVKNVRVQESDSSCVELKEADSEEAHSKTQGDVERIIPFLAQVSKTETIANSKESLNSSVNSFRLSVKTMHFSVDGRKKINYHSAIKPQDNKIRTANPPGVLFSIEVVIPFLPKGKSRYIKPFEVSSRNFTGEEVIFDGAVVQKTLKGSENPWKKVSNAIGGCQVKALWRHLNQRIPSVLGTGLLPDEIYSDDFETTLVLQIYTQHGLPAAKIEFKIELGLANCFGNELLGGAGKNKKTGSAHENPRKLNEAERGVTPAPISSVNTPVDHSKVGAILEPTSEETKFDDYGRKEPSTDSVEVLEEVVTLDNQLLHAIDSLQEKLNKKTTVVEETVTDAVVPTETLQGNSEKKTCPTTCCCCCKCCHGSDFHGKNPSSTRVGTTQIPSSSSSERVSTRRNRRRRRHRARPAENSDNYDTMSLDFQDRHPEIGQNYVTKTKEKIYHERRHYENVDELVTIENERKTQPSTPGIDPPPPTPPSFGIPLEPPTSEGTVIHRYKIDVYSCDAQVFYKQGILEFYLSYRFPLVNPIYEKVELSQTPTVIELSGEPSFQSHILKLNRKLSDALRSLSGRAITFEIWARSFMYDKRNFLLGQAEIPTERLLEWEASYDYSEKRRVAGNFYPPDKHFVNLRIKSVRGEFPQGLDGDMISQLGLEVEYEKVGGVNRAGQDVPEDKLALGRLPDERIIPELDKPSDMWNREQEECLRLKKNKGASSWTVKLANKPETCSSTARKEPYNWRPMNESPRQESEWGAHELQEMHPFPEPDLDSPLSFTPYQGVPSFIERDLSPRRERDFPEGTHFVDLTKETNTTVNSITTRRSFEERRNFLTDENFDSHHQTNEEPARFMPRLDDSIDIGSDSKATQTSQELASAMDSRVSTQQSVELFSARVEIEMALNLSPVLNRQGSIVVVKPTTHVEFQAWMKNLEVTLSTPPIKEESNPEYNCSWNIHLPVHYLCKNDSEMEFRLIYDNDPSTILKAYVDLTTLSAGLSSVNGWYSLGNNGHKSAGQIKVSVTPLDDIRKYKHIWMNEYRRKSNEMKKYGANSKCEAAQKMKMIDSQRTESLRQKIKELELLTKKMKDKMANMESWGKSPPDRLMRQVDEFSRRLDREEGPLNVSEESMAESPLDEEEIDEQQYFRSVPPQIISSSSSDGQNSPVRDFNFEKTTPVSDKQSNESSSIANFRRLSLDSNSASLPVPFLSQCLSELDALPKDSLDAASEAIERIISDLKKQKMDE